MLLILYIAIFALIFVKAKYNLTGFNRDEYLSRNVTDAIKGVFIITVFISHVRGYFTCTSELDIMGRTVANWLGQLIVTMFMFCSGYGVAEAIKHKGAGYVRPFPKNRILKTLLHFDIAIILFLILGLIMGKTYKLKTVLLAFISWTSVGNSNWYIFAVLMLYVMTWISFSIIRKNKYAGAVLLTALTVAYILVMHRIRPTERWWYDTVLCYPLGMWYSYLKEKAEKIIMKNNFFWAGAFVLLAAAFLVSHKFCDFFVMQEISVMSLCLLITLASMKISVHNRVLIWLGQHTFEIFILQRLPMIIFKSLGVIDISKELYVIICLICTLILAFAFKKATDALDSHLFKKPVKA